jgi:ribosomal protein S6--L-glutamate ligase
VKLISFDVLRTLDIPGVCYLKPDQCFQGRDLIQSADWLLFPEYWQVNSLVYGWRTRIFPSISTYHIGHDKVQMTRAFGAVAPAYTPQTAILPSSKRSVEQVFDEFNFPFVAKEVRSSMGQGVHLIEQRADFLPYAANTPVLYVQEYLPIRRDLRIVWVGDKIVASYWREAAEGRFHNNVSQGGRVSFGHVPEAATGLVEQVARSLGIDHAGFDVADVDGHYFLLEFNVRFGTQALNTHGIRTGPAILEYLAQQMPDRWNGELETSISR